MIHGKKDNSVGFKEILGLLKIIRQSKKLTDALIKASEAIKDYSPESSLTWYKGKKEKEGYTKLLHNRLDPVEVEFVSSFKELVYESKDFFVANIRLGFYAGPEFFDVKPTEELKKLKLPFVPFMVGEGNYIGYHHEHGWGVFHHEESMHKPVRKWDNFNSMFRDVIEDSVKYHYKEHAIRTKPSLAKRLGFESQQLPSMGW